MLHLDALPMWLATIEPSRVAAEARPRLERFQLECAKALRDHFFGQHHPHEENVEDVDPVDPAAEPRRYTHAEHCARLEEAERSTREAMHAAATSALDAFLLETESARFLHRGLEAKLLAELVRYGKETEGGISASLSLQSPILNLIQLTTIERHRRERRRTWLGEHVVTEPLFASRTTHELGPAEREAREVVVALGEIAGGREWSAADLLEELAKRDGAPRFEGSTKQLGRLLARHRDTLIVGRSCARAGTRTASGCSGASSRR